MTRHFISAGHSHSRVTSRREIRTGPARVSCLATSPPPRNCRARRLAVISLNFQETFGRAYALHVRRRLSTGHNSNSAMSGKESLRIVDSLQQRAANSPFQSRVQLPLPSLPRARARGALERERERELCGTEHRATDGATFANDKSQRVILRRETCRNETHFKRRREIKRRESMLNSSDNPFPIVDGFTCGYASL